MSAVRLLVSLMAFSALGGCAHYAAAPMTVAGLKAPAATGGLPADPDELLHLALQNDPAIAAARATLTAELKGRDAARNSPPLSLSLTTEYSKDADPARPWLFGGSVGVPLDPGVKRQARVTVADLKVLKARTALADAVWAARQRLRQSLSDLAMARGQIRVAETLVQQRQAYLTALETRVARGEDAHALAAQAQLDASAAAQFLQQVRAREVQAQIDLARALNVSMGAVQALPPIDVLSVGDLDGSTVVAMNDKALYSRSEILTAVIDYDLAENDLRAAITAQYPDISLSPGYTWERGVVKIPLSLSLSLPPLDGNRAAIAQAQSARLAAGKTLEDRVRTVQAEASRATAALRSDLTTARTLRSHDLTVSQDQARRAGRALAAGEIDRGEALFAEIAATQSELNALQAEQTVVDDRLRLEDATRQTFDTGEMPKLADEVKK